MRVTTALWALGLSALSTEALPASSASQSSTPKPSDPSKSLLSSIPKSSVSAAKAAKIICDSPFSDVRGNGTGKSGKEIWKESDMDSFLAILDHIPYTKDASLPETLADLGHASGRPVCTIKRCDPFQWSGSEECTSHDGMNAKFSEIYRGLSNVAIFLDGVGSNMLTAGLLMSNKANNYIDHLHPLKLKKSANAGFSIIIAGILGALAAYVFKLPWIAAGLATAAGGFALITGAITQTATNNEQELLNKMEGQNNLTAAITFLIEGGVNGLKKQAEKIIEDPPQNTKDKPYSSYEWSAVNLLKGGNFGDAPASKITDDIGHATQRTLLTGLIMQAFEDKVIYFEALEPIFDKQPCDWDYPSEFYRHCIGATAYFFAKATKNKWPGDKWDNIADFDPWKSLTDEKNKDFYMGITLTDLIHESKNTEEIWGMGKEWDYKDDKSMDLLVDQAKKSERVSMANLWGFKLDPADQDPPPYKKLLGSDAVSPSVGHWKSDHEKFRFMMWQAVHETKSKGKSYPRELVSQSWKHWCYEYDGRKWDPMNNWDPRK